MSASNYSNKGSSNVRVHFAQQNSTVDDFLFINLQTFRKKIIIYMDFILTSYTFTDSPPTLPFSEK